MTKFFFTATTLLGLSALQLHAQLYTPNGTVGSTTNPTTNRIGIGNATPSNVLHVRTNVSNDGIQVEQTSSGSAALHLWNTNQSGHNWAILSTNSANLQGAGKLLFYDYSATVGSALRMQIDANGNLGLGYFANTNSPLTRMHLRTSTANDGIRVEQYGTSGSALIGLYNSSSGARNWTLQATGNTSPDGSGNFILRNESSNTTNLFVSGATGSIGIGTNNPQGGKLHIYTNNSSGLCVEHAVTYNYDFAVKVRVNRDLTKAFSVINNGTEVMTVWGTGVINTPKLYAEEVQVLANSENNPWPDFVFAPGYRLMPLDSVETYYTANNHLPGVPSQEEVQQNGIDVYSMNAILLQKIEELTLYVVEQQKQIAELKEEVNK